MNYLLFLYNKKYKYNQKKKFTYIFISASCGGQIYPF